MINWSLAKYGIFKVNEWIYVGQFPKEESLKKLSELGITVILNVSGGNYSNEKINVINFPVEDLTEMPLNIAEEIAACIKDSVESGKKIYVHCMAGQNRSPGSVLLGLIALGYKEDVAIKMIEENTLDSVAKHYKILTDKVLNHIKSRYAA